MKLLTVKYCLLFVSVLLAASCSSIPSKKYYTLVNEGAGKAQSAAPVCSMPLVLVSVEASPPYDSDKIIFRTDKYEIKLYNYKLWAGTPEDMMQRLLAEKIRKRNLFKTIESYIHSSSRHIALYARILNIEQIKKGKKWEARLAMDFALRDSRTEETLWEFRFDRAVPIKKNDMADFIAMLNSIYNNEADRMVASLHSFISSYEGCK